MSSLYLGSGFRCLVSDICSFRVMPASGDDQDLDEAALIKRSHEQRPHRYGGQAVGARPPQNVDDRRTDLASSRVNLDEEQLAAASSSKRMTEPTGRGWRAVITDYVKAHPQTTAREIAIAVGCKPNTAATYLSDVRTRAA